MSIVHIAGIGMTRFGKHPDATPRSLAIDAAQAALADLGIGGGDVEAFYLGNAAAGIISGQVCVLGEIVGRALGIGGVPVLNVENACASASTALYQGYHAVRSGQHDIVLVAGTEKLTHPDPARTFSVFAGCVDVDDPAGLDDYLDRLNHEAGIERNGDDAGKRSVFMDIYAARAVAHMARHGTTREQFAMVAAKNARHGSLNPRAQFEKAMSVEEILAAREIVYPLTLPMCSPVGDGAAAAVLVSAAVAAKLGVASAPQITACVLTSGTGPEDEPARRASQRAYELAGVGPDDLDIVELHDASAPAELMLYESLGLVAPGEGGALLASGATALGGATPVNTSGGLLRKGHPIGATGLAQIFELTTQLRGAAGARQVEGARVGLAENGGGLVDGATGACVVTILER